MTNPLCTWGAGSWHVRPVAEPGHTCAQNIQQKTCRQAHETRENWFIYRGSSFLAIVFFGSSPTSSLFSPVSKLSLFLGFFVCRPSSLLTGRRWGGGGERAGVEPNHTTARKLGPLQIVQSSLHETKRHNAVCSELWNRLNRSVDSRHLSLVSDIPAGDGKTASLFLQCIHGIDVNTYNDWQTRRLANRCIEYSTRKANKIINR